MGKKCGSDGRGRVLCTWWDNAEQGKRADTCTSVKGLIATLSLSCVSFIGGGRVVRRIAAMMCLWTVS